MLKYRCLKWSCFDLYSNVANERFVIYGTLLKKSEVPLSNELLDAGAYEWQDFVLDGSWAGKEQLTVKHEINSENQMLYESIICYAHILNT